MTEAVQISAAAQELEELTSDMVVDTMERNGELSPEFNAYKTNLWENPKDRNLLILEQFIDYLAERDAEYFGSEEIAFAYWDKLGEDAAELSFDEVNDIPVPKRGDGWATTRALLDAWCWRESYVVIYGKEDMMAGAKNGKEVERLAPQTEESDYKNGHNIKASVKALGLEAKKLGITARELLDRRSALAAEIEGE